MKLNLPGGFDKVSIMKRYAYKLLLMVSKNEKTRKPPNMKTIMSAYV